MSKSPKTNESLVTTKFQLCRYQVSSGGQVRTGLAWMRHLFDLYDVRFVVDAETGEKQPTVWHYDLLNGPLNHIDSEYAA